MLFKLLGWGIFLFILCEAQSDTALETVMNPVSSPIFLLIKHMACVTHFNEVAALVRSYA